MPDFKAKKYIAQKGLQVLSRASLLAAAAIANLKKAVAPLLDATDAAAASRTGLVVGTAFGHIESKTRYSEEAAREGVALVSPILFPNTIINALGGHAAILFGFRGPNSTVTAGARSGLDAVIHGADLLESGRADRVAVVGCDEVSRPLLDGLLALGLLAREDPQGPRASIPLDPRRSGIYPAEAAAAILLTREAETDAPTVQAAISGFASVSSVRRGLRGAVREAMEAALRAAKRQPPEINWVALSGSGSTALDGPEAEAFEAVFGSKAPSRALKRQLGETFGAGALLAAIAAVHSLRESPGARAVLVSAVDEDGASAMVVSAP